MFSFDLFEKLNLIDLMTKKQLKLEEIERKKRESIDFLDSNVKKPNSKLMECLLKLRVNELPSSKESFLLIGAEIPEVGLGHMGLHCFFNHYHNLRLVWR